MIHTTIDAIKEKVAELDWAERLTGLVRAVRDPAVGGQRFTYPISFDVDGKECWENQQYKDLLPNDLYKSVIYFEQRGAISNNAFDEADSKRRRRSYSFNLRLVCWVNLNKIGTDQLLTTDRLLLEIQEKIMEGTGEESQEGIFNITDSNYTGLYLQLNLAGIPEKDLSIFSRYSIGEYDHALVYPFDFFALDFQAVVSLGKDCFTAYTVTDEIECEDHIDVAPAVPSNSVAPVVSGIGYAGQTMNVTTGTWNANNSTITGYTYQWQSNGSDISGATANSYLVTESEEGTSITCIVTATNGEGSTAATSNAIHSWIPLDSTGARYYDPTDTDSITDAAGVVSQIDDKGAGAEHLTQVTPGAEPTTGTRTLGGFNLLDFDGGDFLVKTSFTMSNDHSVVALMIIDSVNHSGCSAWSFDGATNGDYAMQASNSTQYRHQYIDPTPLLISDGTDQTGSVHLFGVSRSTTSPGTVQVFVDGVETDTADGFLITDASGTFRIGVNAIGNRFVNGAMGIFVVLNSVDEDERQMAEGYICHKMGQTALLDSGHPYKTDAPTV